MKIEWNKKYTTVAVYSLIVIAIAVLFVVFVFRFESFADGFSWVGSVVAPVICGLIIAYVLNPLMMYFENKFFKKLKNPPEKIAAEVKRTPDAETSKIEKIKEKVTDAAKSARRKKTLARVLSLLITFAVVFIVLGTLVIAIGPSIASSIVDLADKFPTYIKEIEEYLEDFFKDNPEISEFIFDDRTQKACRNA